MTIITKERENAYEWKQTKDRRQKKKQVSQMTSSPGFVELKWL